MTQLANYHQLLKEYINAFPSPNSRLAYIRDLKQFQNWCLQEGIEDLFEVDEKKAQHYNEFLLEKFAPVTIERKLSVIKNFYRLAEKKGLTPCDPFQTIVPPTKKKTTLKKAYKALDHSEVERILLFPNLKTEEGSRDYTMLFLLFSLGLKIGEVVNLHVNDFKKYETGFLVHLRKTAKTSYYSKVPQNCLDVINRYLNEWHIKGFLFTSIAKNSPVRQEERQPLTVRSGWVILKKYLQKAKLERKGRTTNCAREFFIQAVKKQGYSPKVLKKILGLQSFNAMRRYGLETIQDAKETLTFRDHPVDRIKLEIREY